MSEEEILEKIEKIIKHFESQEYILNGQKIYKYIQGLLDLYNKQKEKIKSLESQLDFIGEQNKYIDKLEKEKDKLEKEIDKNISKLSDSLGVKKYLI